MPAARGLAAGLVKNSPKVSLNRVSDSPNNNVCGIPLKSAFPDLETAEQVRTRYANYPGYEEKIKEFGIIGFELA